MVRIAVARFEFTPSMPIFARIEVSAANTADSKAKINHIMTHLPYFLQPIGIGVCARIEITAIANKTIRTAAAIRINFRFIVSPHKKTEKGAIMAPLLS